VCEQGPLRGFPVTSGVSENRTPRHRDSFQSVGVGKLLAACDGRIILYTPYNIYIVTRRYCNDIGVQLGKTDLWSLPTDRPPPPTLSVSKRFAKFIGPSFEKQSKTHLPVVPTDRTPRYNNRTIEINTSEIYSYAP